MEIRLTHVLFFTHGVQILFSFINPRFPLLLYHGFFPTKSEEQVLICAFSKIQVKFHRECLIKVCLVVHHKMN